MSDPPGIDPVGSRADAGPAPPLTARPPTSPPADAAPDATLESAAVAALADQLHIHPLDLNGALQILIAEARTQLPLSGDAPHGAARLEPFLLAGGGLPAEPLEATAPQTLVGLFLQALPPPETLQPPVWLAFVMRIESALQVALDRAMSAVVAWRDVPTGVVDAARQTRELVVAAIIDEPPNLLWLRPEWLGLAPRMERYWRRRRRARRGLSDPDLRWRDRDEDDETERSGRIR